MSKINHAHLPDHDNDDECVSASLIPDSPKRSLKGFKHGNPWSQLGQPRGAAQPHQPEVGHKRIRMQSSPALQYSDLSFAETRRR